MSGSASFQGVRTSRARSVVKEHAGGTWALQAGKLVKPTNQVFVPQPSPSVPSYAKYEWQKDRKHRPSNHTNCSLLGRSERESAPQAPCRRWDIGRILRVSRS